MDDDSLYTYRVQSPPRIDRIDGFKKGGGQNNRQGFFKKKKPKKAKDAFKDAFCEYFGLDGDRFSINLIKMDGKWKVRICNKLTNRCLLQDYEVLCGILNRSCKLPDAIGVNVDKKA